MPTLKPGYATQTSLLKTASGEDSAVRALDAMNAIVVHDDGTEQNVAQAVVKYVIQDTEEKAAKAAKEKAAEVIRLFAGTVRDENALNGDYQKTLRIVGSEIKNTQYAVDASHIDKFSVPKKKADLDALKATLGTAFNSIFEPTIEISIKKSVLENDDLRKELSAALFKALGADGIRKYFDKEETFRVKKGMAEAQYALEKTVREALRKNVKQTADALKDASGPVA